MDYSFIKQLSDFMDSNNITELEKDEKGFHIKIIKNTKKDTNIDKVKEEKKEDKKNYHIIKSSWVGTISRIYKKENENIEKDEVIAEITMLDLKFELKSQYKGRVEKIFVKENENVEYNSKIAEIVIM